MKAALFCAALALSPALAAASAPAPQGRRVGGVLRFGQDVAVAAGDAVDGGVLAVRGSVSVLGRVDGPAVALGGSVSVGSGASVDGPVLAVGGSASVEPGASVKGPVLELPFGALKAASLLLASLLGLAGGLWLLYGLLSVLGWTAAAACAWLIFPKSVENGAQAVGLRPWACALAGLVFWPALGVLTLLLTLSLLGIPLLPLVALVLLCAWLWGFAVLGLCLGRRLPGLRERTLPALVAGAVLLRLAACIPIAGKLVFLATALPGIGAALLTRLGTRPAGRGKESA